MTQQEARERVLAEWNGFLEQTTADGAGNGVALAVLMDPRFRRWMYLCFLAGTSSGIQLAALNGASSQQHATPLAMAVLNLAVDLQQEALNSK